MPVSKSSAMTAAGRAMYVPPPFAVDMGALCLSADRLAELEYNPVASLVALCDAVEQDLHVGRALLDQIRSGGAPSSLKLVEPSARGLLLGRVLAGDRPALKVDAAQRAGLLRHIAPDVGRLYDMPKGNGLYKDVYTHTLRVLDATPDDPITRLAALLHDAAKPETLVVEGGAARFPNHDLLGAERAARQLRSLCFDHDVVTAVGTLIRLHLRANSYEPTWTDSAVRRLHLDAGPQWGRLLDLSYADVTSARAEVVLRAHRRVHELEEHALSLDAPIEVSPLDGTALMARFGRGPGRWIGELKQCLAAKVEDGTLDPDDVAASWQAAEQFVELLAADTR